MDTTLPNYLLITSPRSKRLYQEFNYRPFWLGNRLASSLIGEEENSIAVGGDVWVNSKPVFSKGVRYKDA